MTTVGPVVRVRARVMPVPASVPAILVPASVPATLAAASVAMAAVSRALVRVLPAACRRVLRVRVRVRPVLVRVVRVRATIRSPPPRAWVRPHVLRAPRVDARGSRVRRPAVVPVAVVRVVAVPVRVAAAPACRARIRR